MAVENMLQRRLGLVIAVAAVFLLSPAASAQDSWEGNAAIIRHGEFTSPGLFAASDAFPLQSRVRVTNLQNGQQVEVTVVRRAGAAGTIFLLLSEEAAAKIGLPATEVARVRAALASTPPAPVAEPPGEQAFTEDPDFNPAVSLSGGKIEEITAAAAARPTEPEPEAAVPVVAEAPSPAAVPAQPAAPEQPAAEQPAQPMAEPAVAEPPPATAQPVAEPPAVAEAAATTPAAAAPAVAAVAAVAAAEAAPAVEAPAAEQPTAEQAGLARLAERLPQKQLFLPPHETLLAGGPTPEVLAAAPEPAPPAAAEAPPAASPAASAPVAEERPVASLPAPAGGERPQDVDVELPGPGPAPAGEPSPEGTRLAAPAQEAPLPADAQMPIAAPAAVAAAPAPAPSPKAAVEAPAPPVAIQAVPAEAPAAPAPPAAPTPPTPKASPAPTPAKAPLPASASLPRRSYFVQLGAYTTEGLAEKLASQLRSTYDVVVLAADSSGRLFYKVLVGPLNRDESGTLLYQFRARGFKDAFVQYVE